MIDTIEIREHTGRSGKTYPQWFDSDGKMVGCGCDEAKAVTVEKYHMKPCHHRLAYNAALEAITGGDVMPHIEDELRSRALSYEGCDFCGKNHKSWNCPF